MSMRLDELRRLLHLLDITAVDEIDCTEFMHRVGAYTEQIEAGRVPPPGFEAVTQHLRVCPECVEEFEAMYRALRGE